MNWRKFKVSREKIKYLKSRKDIEIPSSKINLRKAERNKTINIGETKEFIPSINLQKRMKKTKAEAEEDFIDDHLQTHSRMRTNYT